MRISLLSISGKPAYGRTVYLNSHRNVDRPVDLSNGSYSWQSVALRHPSLPCAFP
jgi:hypothetical protein